MCYWETVREIAVILKFKILEKINVREEEKH